MAGITWHYVFKFIITGKPRLLLSEVKANDIAGDASVGKSSLLVRLTDQRFLANPDPTLGVEFGSKLITIPEDKKIIKLQCWDTAGSESFRAITRSYYRGAAGCLLVYDVTSRKSFENARHWLADVRKYADPHVSCILVGNKVDLCEDYPHNEGDTAVSASPSKPTHVKSRSATLSSKGKAREVPFEEAELWAKEEGMLFVEASAKSGLNVEQAFIDASRDILDKIRQGVFDDDKSPGVKLSKPSITLDASTARASCCGS